MRRLIFLSVTILVAACEPGDIVNVPSGPWKTTILSFNEVGKPWYILVGLSKSTAPHAVESDMTNAIVKIYEDGNFVEQLQFDTLFAGYIQTALYTSETNSPRAGHEYQIVVEAPGFETASAKYQQPLPIPADITFTLKSHEKRTVPDVNPNAPPNTFERWTFEINVTFTDPPGDNFYDFQLESAREEASLGKVLGQEYIVSGGPFAIDFLTGSIINDKKISGKRTTFTFQYYTDRDERREPPPWFRMSLRTTTEAQYKFLTKMRKSMDAYYDPYAQPVTTFTNVENGLGIFGGYTPHSKVFNYSFEE